MVIAYDLLPEVLLGKIHLGKGNSLQHQRSISVAFWRGKCDSSCFAFACNWWIWITVHNQGTCTREDETKEGKRSLWNVILEYVMFRSGKAGEAGPHLIDWGLSSHMLPKMFSSCIWEPFWGLQKLYATSAGLLKASWKCLNSTSGFWHSLCML